MTSIDQAFIQADEIAEIIRAEHPITCKRGCSHCCYIPNIVTIVEAENLINKERLPDTKSLLSKLVPENNLVLMGEADRFCAEVPSEIRKCLYLKNDECSVYKNRPISCRGNLVVTDPKLCDTRCEQTGELVGYVDHMPFSMLALELSMDLNVLPVQLFRVLRSRGMI